MGNIVAFQRRTEIVSFDTTSGRRLPPCENKDLATGPKAGLPQSGHAHSATSQASQTVFERFGLTQFARDLVKTGERPDHDAYLLVLLADQELIAGRDSEARSLVDAAYAAFDR